TTFDYVDRGASGGADLSEFVFKPPEGSKIFDDGSEAFARKVDPKAKSGDRAKTTLMEFAADGRVSSVRILLDRGAEIDAKSRDGETALMLASLGNHADVARLLRHRGAKI